VGYAHSIYYSLIPFYLLAHVSSLVQGQLWYSCSCSFLSPCSLYTFSTSPVFSSSGGSGSGGGGGGGGGPDGVKTGLGERTLCG